MSDNKTREANNRLRLARKIARDLFTSGTKQHADRLVLTGSNGRDMGGWCEEAAADRIAEVLMEFKESELTDLMALAIKRRDELNVFIKLLTNVFQGRDLVEDCE